MNREDIIARLRENEAELRRRGVADAALFGSRARGDDRADSDTATRGSWHPITGRAIPRYHVRLRRDRFRDARRRGEARTPPHPRTHGRGRADAKAKGVKSRRKPKLTPHGQRKARVRLTDGETQRSVTRSYNVSQATISGLPL